MKIKTLALATALIGLGATQAHASDITLTTAFSGAAYLADANIYRSVVNQAILDNVVPTGYGSTGISLYDGISNHSIFGGPTGNIAFKSVFDFGVTASNAGAWDFRFGVDFGGGGAVFLDGNAVTFQNHDMWWAGSYSDTSQYFQLDAINLTSGNHRLEVFGFEGCCDGGQQAQFRGPGNKDYVTFGARDGLNLVPVPEPESYAMLLAGLGVLGAIARRKHQG